MHLGSHETEILLVFLQRNKSRAKLLGAPLKIQSSKQNEARAKNGNAAYN